MRDYLARLLLSAFLLLCDAPALRAQDSGWGPLPAKPNDAHTQITTLGINTALGVVVVGAGQLLRREPSAAGLWRGALGGGVAFAGKRVAVEPFYGAGLLGRQLHAAGTFLVDHAARGAESSPLLMLPVGPVRLHVRISEGLEVRPRFDLASGMATVYAATRPGMHWDATASLSAGALVFRTKGRTAGSDASGTHSAGVLWIEADEADWRAGSARRLFAHERVHVLQHDLAQALVGLPLQGALKARAPALAPLMEHVDFGLVMPLWGAANALVPYAQRPWEREASLLMRRPAPW